MRHPRTYLVLALLLALSPGLLMAAPPPGTIVDVSYDPSAVIFEPVIAHGGITLTVTDSRKFLHTQEFDPRDGGILDIRSFKDGVYNWQIHARPDINKDLAAQIAQARKDNDMTLVCDLQDKGILPLSPMMQNGTFTIVSGRLVDPYRTEESSGEAQAAAEASRTNRAAEGVTNATDEFYASGDLYVHNSACIGFDCPTSGLAFGADTIRLKENNLRIHFEDTSTAASFPTTDWRIIANDQANGGLSRFSIQDASANRISFTIEANAPTNSLYVDNGGRVGVGTGNPVTEIHSVSGDTPTLRLAQDTSSGFAAQTWDIAGNETSFFIRDATNGSTLPFRIRPGAASNSLVIADDNDIGIGVLTPDADVRLQVQANTNSNFGGLRVENDGTGNIQTQFVNNADDWEWRQNFRQTRLDFNFGAVGSVSTQFSLESTGDAEFQGDVTANGVLLTSDRAAKQDFQPVDSTTILEKIGALPVSSWSYKRDQGAVRHIGPVAQDFHAAFGLGSSDKHISSVDADGVALAAIQALYQRLMEKEQVIEDLQHRLEALENTEP
ncbi:MAG: tail fiber domain-containing protein [Acidobacteriota bacterium]|nr:tail fiber domain-containing protein [Acidobacteriota bacterium]